VAKCVYWFCFTGQQGFVLYELGGCAESGKDGKAGESSVCVIFSRQHLLPSSFTIRLILPPATEVTSYNMSKEHNLCLARLTVTLILIVLAVWWVTAPSFVASKGGT
jgi:hypothetical protein